ncbi:hypothetical protein ACOMHN_035938 [Nucella lapillus]
MRSELKQVAQSLNIAGHSLRRINCKVFVSNDFGNAGTVEELERRCSVWVGPRCGDVEANPGPNPEPSTSRPSTSLRQTRISTPRKSSQSAKDPSLSEVMATLNSINSSLNDKMDGMNTSLNGKMDGVKEDVGQLHQEFGTLSELKKTKDSTSLT